jgi:hypothetical protein
MASTSGTLWKPICQAAGHNNQPHGSSFTLYIATSADIHALKKVFKELPREARKHAAEFNPTDLKFCKALFTVTMNAIFKRELANPEFPDPSWMTKTLATWRWSHSTHPPWRFTIPTF